MSEEVDKVVTNIEGQEIVRNKEYTHGFVNSKVGVYSFDCMGSFSLPSTTILYLNSSHRFLMPAYICGFKLVPNGHENFYPEELRDLLDENNILYAIIHKKFELLWGQGPELYETRFETGKRVKYFDSVPQIQSFLDDWAYKKYLEMVSVEFNSTNGFYDKFYRNKGSRIGGKSIITELKCVANRKARLEWYDENDNIPGIITGNYLKPWERGLTKYPIWDRKNPFQYPVAMRYNNLYGFALDNEYSRSPFHGSRSSIKLGSSIATLLSSFNDNSAALKYHIVVPAIYWTQKKQELEDECLRNGTECTPKLIDKMKDDCFIKFTEVLSNYKNVGKFVTTDKVWHPEAEEFVGWEVNVLDQKIKDFVDAQLSILTQMSREISLGLDLNPALSNISEQGVLGSGSNLLYAFKLYLMTSVDIPEMIITQGINDAIQTNFPGTKYKIGFYHDAVITESQTSPADRVKNSGPNGTEPSSN